MPKIRWHFFPDRVYYAERASLHPNQTSAYRRVNLRVASINHRQVHCTSVQPNTSCTALLVQLPFTVPMSLSRAFGQYAPMVYGWRLGVVVSVVGRINEVNQHRARLVHDG